MPSCALRFESDQYIVVRGILDSPACGFLENYAVGLARHGHLSEGDNLIPGTPCRYGDPFMESLLLHLQPRIEAACGLDLLPTYSYFRVYKNGDQLPRHQDRPSCEISATVNLGPRNTAPWPIWIESSGEHIAINLAPGDALLYRGLEVPHWRQPFPGEQLTQVFLHYVERNGPCKEWKFDGRADLSTQPHAERIMRKLLVTADS